VSQLDHMLEPGTSVRRVELITETGGRRQFLTVDKARFVEETLAANTVEARRPCIEVDRRQLVTNAGGPCQASKSLPLFSEESIGRSLGHRSRHPASLDDNLIPVLGLVLKG
jgi:hypothetical protein